MIRFAANLTFLFADVPFEDRPARAARAGFEGVECLFPDSVPEVALAERLVGCGVEMVVFNAPAGDWHAGERGIAGIPHRGAEVRSGLLRARDLALALGCKRIHVMAGRTIDGADLATYIGSLRLAVELCALHGIDVLVEPLNPIDYPDYLVADLDIAVHAVEAAGAGVGLQFDAYHLAMCGLDPVATAERVAPLIGHVQVAGPPTRHEPTPDRLDVSGLVAMLSRRGYRGWIGCEYRPETTTEEGLGWLAPFIKRGGSDA